MRCAIQSRRYQYEEFYSLPRYNTDMNEDNKITVSIIMLTYNHEKYVTEAIKSVLAQNTAYRYELLIGDDNSSDNTREIICEYAQRYPEIIRPFFHQKNMGCTANLLYVYKQASGKYIAYIEGDDKWISDTKLQQQIDFLEKNKEYSAATNLIEIISENNEIIDGKLSWISEKEIFTAKDFDGITLPGQTSSLVHRNIYAAEPELLSSYSWDQNIGDRITMIHLLKYGKIKCIQEKLSAYRYIRKAESTNITSKVYHNRLTGLLADIELNYTVYSFARKNKIRYRVIKSKQLLFVRAILTGLLSDKKGRLLIKKSMIHFERKPFYYFTLPIALVRFLSQKICSIRCLK